MTRKTRHFPLLLTAFVTLPACAHEETARRPLVPARVSEGSPEKARPSRDVPGDTWAFEPKPDNFSPNALIDLRSMNETTAGESGFIRVSADGDFLTGNGKPIRFWAVGTDVGREKEFRPRPLGRKTAPDLARHARFLAKRGVNMVRCHAQISPGPDQLPTAINENERDWIWRTVAAMKKEGIYTTISPYWAVPQKFGPNWKIPGGADQSALGLLFFDETLQGYYREWMRKLLAEKNPYTGIPLAQDPAVAILSLQNEDSLLFWTVNGIKGEQRKRLGRKFAEWVKKKRGSLEAALTAWEQDTLPGDDRAAGILDFHNIWEMTQERTGGRTARLADQLAFWSETMYNFHRDTAGYLRNELGCKQVINAGNWKTADTGRLNDAERWSYTANEVLAVNRYYGGLHEGKNNGWAIENGDTFTSPSLLRDPLPFPLNLKQVKGFPMLVTESNWTMPTGYASEGPFLISVYQSLTGIDAYYWFATGDDEWTPPQSANGYLPSQAKWLFGNPDMLGTFPAAALLFRKGYVRRGQPVVAEQRRLDDLWQRRPPILSEESSFDPNRDSGSLAPSSSVKRILPPATFLAGPAEVTYGGDPARSTTADLPGLVDPENKVVRSITGEIVLNYGKGVCRVDAPKAQGMAAFFQEAGGRLATTDLEVTSQNEYGHLLAVSMDDRPLKSSGKILVQVGTRCRPTDWKETPTTIDSNGRKVSGFRVENYGKAPWQVVSPKMTVTLRNPGITRATVTDMNGNPTGTVPLSKVTGGVRFEFPGKAMYVVLQ
ncbi:MAG: hypothetical protein SFU56_05370 [Capsulimonadales bacterium]|nr:hypothetical protein [Capsulimonadales bacterium]